MRILHVTTDTNYGGVQEAVVGICRYAAQYGRPDGHHVLRLCAGKYEAVFRRFATVHDAGEEYCQAAPVARAIGADLVHLHMPGGTFPRFVAELRATGIPLVESIHCVNRALPQEEAAMAARIVASRHVYDLQGSKERLHVVPYAIDPELWAAEQPADARASRRAWRAAQLGLPEHGLAIGRLGNVTPWKKVADFVRAVPAILARSNGGGPPVGFFVAGSVQEAPRYAASVINTADLLFVRDRVRFVWDLDRAAKYAFLSMLDVFLYPTSREGYCIAAVEAMSMGVPVVTYRCSALPETVPASAGALVEPGDTDALARAVLELVHDPELRRRKGAAAAELVRSRNFPEVVGPQYERVYAGVV